MQSDMPPNEYYELFKPDYSLFIKKDTSMRNENTTQKCDKVSDLVWQGRVWGRGGGGGSKESQVGLWPKQVGSSFER